MIDPSARPCGAYFPFDTTNAMLCDRPEEHRGEHRFIDTSGSYYWRFVPPTEAKP